MHRAHIPGAAIDTVAVVGTRLSVAVVTDTHSTRHQIARVTCVTVRSRVARRARARVATVAVVARASVLARTVHAVVGDANTAIARVACKTDMTTMQIL